MSPPPASAPAASSDGASKPRPAALQRLGRYRIVRPLSKGGMALVYEARRDSLAGVSPQVAIKLILPEHAASKTYKDLFINEARLGSSMRHQNLVQIQDFDCEGDTWFLVMEYVEGFTLRRVIGAATRFNLTLPLSVIAEIGRQACDGLHYAHEASDENGRALELVHRDIKPSNLILSPHGVVKVLDFGISKGRLREERAGSVKGTWGYMAPEQAVGDEVDPASDVFGLATVLYELAARTPMFNNRKKEDIRRLLKDDHAARIASTLNPKDYGPLISVLVRALQRDAATRYRTAESFGRALSALLPDTITARDDVVKFYAHIVKLEEQAKIQAATGEVPRPVVAPSEPDAASSPAAPPSFFLTFAVGALVSAGLLVALGLFSVVMLTEPPAATTEPHAEIVAPIAPAEPPGSAAEPVLDAEPEPEPVTVTITRRAPEPLPEETPELLVDVQADARQGSANIIPDSDTAMLRIGSKQGAEVYIGGQYIGDAPIEHEVPPGRYALAIVASDGRRKTLSIEVAAGEAVKRMWDFDRMEWR